MKQSMRHLTFLLLALLSTLQTWAAPELVSNITGGSLAFFGEEACTTRLDNAAISSLTAGTDVYFKVKTDGLHTTAVTAADFTVEVNSGTGAAESRRSIDIGTDPTVTIKATATPGVFRFGVLDARLVFSATLPERTDTGISVNYIDAEGHEATATGVYALDGSEDMLGAEGTTTWFFCQTPVSTENPDGFVFDHELTLFGNVNIIIADGAKLTVDSPDGNGICNYDGSIGFYGQSTGNSQGQLSVTGPDYDGIHAGSYYNSFDVTISSLKVVVEGNSQGIYASNNLTVWGGEVTATGTSYAIYGYDGVSITSISQLSAQSTNNNGIYSSSGNITIAGGSNGAVVNVNDETTSTSTAMYASYNISITGISQLTVGNARSGYGIYAYSGSVTLEGGEVTVTGTSQAISGCNGVSITSISKLTVQSTNSNGIYSSSGDITIAGGSNGAVVNVNDETTSTSTAMYASYNISITGISQLTVGNARSGNGIYASSGTLTLEGGEVTVTGTSEAISGCNGVSITNISQLSAQSTNNNGIYSSSGDITIAGGSNGAVVNVNDETASTFTAIWASSGVSITGISQLTVGNARSGNGIYASSGSVTLEGGEVTVTGTSEAIYGYDGVTLSLTDETGFIYASSYSGTVKIADGQTFYDEDGNTYSGTLDDNDDIAGKTLRLLGNGYYLVGTMTDWGINADYLLTVNPGNTSEYMIQNVPLTGGSEFKVVGYDASTGNWTWYPNNGGNYAITADGIYDIYFRPDYQGGNGWHYGCIYVTDDSHVSVTFARAGFCTYYNKLCDVELPTGVKARIVTDTGDGVGALIYETIADGDTDNKVVPAGTAVMLQTEKSESDQQKTLTLAVHDANSPAAPAVNLLHGHDADGKTIGDGKHYKLTYGNDNTPNAEVFGWYWGAADGAAFTLAGHKAWLVLPYDLAGARSFLALPDDDETTGVVEMRNEQGEMRNSDAWYDLSGRKLDNGQRSMANGQWSKGVYIHNGRKVVIK